MCLWVCPLNKLQCPLQACLSPENSLAVALQRAAWGQIPRDASAGRLPLWQSWAWWSLAMGISPAILSGKAHLPPSLTSLTHHLLSKGSSARAHLRQARKSASSWAVGLWIDLSEGHPLLGVWGRCLSFQDLVLEEPLWVTFLNTSLSWKMGPGW